MPQKIEKRTILLPMKASVLMNNKAAWLDEPGPSEHT